MNIFESIKGMTFERKEISLTVWLVYGQAMLLLGMGMGFVIGLMR